MPPCSYATSPSKGDYPTSPAWNTKGDSFSPSRFLHQNMQGSSSPGGGQWAGTTGVPPYYAGGYKGSYVPPNSYYDQYGGGGGYYDQSPGVVPSYYGGPQFYGGSPPCPPPGAAPYSSGKYTDKGAVYRHEPVVWDHCVRWQSHGLPEAAPPHYMGASYSTHTPVYPHSSSSPTGSQTIGSKWQSAGFREINYSDLPPPAPPSSDVVLTPAPSEGDRTPVRSLDLDGFVRGKREDSAETVDTSPAEKENTPKKEPAAEEVAVYPKHFMLVAFCQMKGRIQKKCNRVVCRRICSISVLMIYKRTNSSGIFGRSMEDFFLS